MFNGYCVDSGVKRRLRQQELREAWRLWCRHRDIREGKLRWGALPMGEEP
jgi:hypothetical protein